MLTGSLRPAAPGTWAFRKADLMTEWLPILGAALIIGIAGEVVKKLVGAKAGDPGVKGLYFVTYKAHGVIVGAAMGVAGHPMGLPTPAAFGTGMAGAVLAYAVAGGIAMVAYQSIVGSLKNAIEHVGKR